MAEIGDEWRKLFVTNMAQKRDNPNAALRVVPGPSPASPSAPDQLRQDLADGMSQGTPEDRQNRPSPDTPFGTPASAPNGTPDSPPEPTQENNRENNWQNNRTEAGLLESLMVILPLAPQEPEIFKNLPGRRKWQTKKSKAQPPATRGSASG